MAMAQTPTRQQTYAAQQGMSRGGPSGLAEVLDVLLDKGLVIDAFVRVSLVGIELLTIDARIVIASVDTYLRFAEAVNRLDLQQASNSQTIGDLVGGGRSKALESRGSRPKGESEEPASDDRADDEPQGGARDEEDHESPSEDDSEQDGGTEAEGDDKGLLTRIKERGQVF